MMVIPANLRRRVIKRAAYCCEYCGLAQTGQEATFHTDHVVPVVAGGQSTSENLALACGLLPLLYPDFEHGSQGHDTGHDTGADTAIGTG